MIGLNYIDLICIALIVLITLEGYKRGFLNSLISFARFLIGAPLAIFISEKYCFPIYDRLVKNVALEKITEKIQSSADTEAIISGAKQSVSELPFNLGQIVDLSFLDKASPDSLANEILQNIVQPIAVLIIKFALFLLTLVVFYVITLIIINLIKGFLSAIKLPYKKADKFLGAVLGLAKAAMVVAVFAAVLAFIAEIGLGEAGSEFIKQINSSSVLEFVNKYNPILSII